MTCHCWPGAGGSCPGRSQQAWSEMRWTWMNLVVGGQCSTTAAVCESARFKPNTPACSAAGTNTGQKNRRPSTFMLQVRPLTPHASRWFSLTPSPLRAFVYPLRSNRMRWVLNTDQCQRADYIEALFVLTTHPSKWLWHSFTLLLPSLSSHPKSTSFSSKYKSFLTFVYVLSWGQE